MATYADNICEIISESARFKQRVLILFLLKQRPHTTIELRERFSVVHPAGRVFELRKLGHQIETVNGHAVDRRGRRHPCAVYHLVGGRP